MAMFGNKPGDINWQRGGMMYPSQMSANGGVENPLLSQFQMAQLPPMLQQPETAPQKPKAFGAGGLGWHILGALGDALQVAGGGQGSYMPTLLDFEQQVAKERHLQQQLDAQLNAPKEVGGNLVQRKADGTYQTLYSAGEKPDEFTRSLIAAGIDPKSPAGVDAFKQRIQHWNDPITTVTLPNGSIYNGPQSGLRDALAGFVSSTPAKPVGKLTPIGGPTQPASGGFR